MRKLFNNIENGINKSAGNTKMAKIMGWDKRGKDRWGNWTGSIYVKRIGNSYTVIRDTKSKSDYGRIIDLVKVSRQKYLSSKMAARAWAIKWMKRNPHYLTYLSEKQICKLDSRLRSKNTSQPGSFR